MKGKRKKLMILIIVTITLVLVEIAGLIWLKSSVGRYEDFWQKKLNESGQITYLALGDSAAQGIGASSPMRGYVGLLVKNLEKQSGKKVRVINISKTGANMKDYLKQQAPKIKKYDADIVTIEIGANDIGSYNELEFRNDFKKVLKSLPDGSYVSNMPIFNSRPKSTNNAKSASRIIEQELKNFEKLHFVDLQKETTKHQSIFNFAPDFFHPNNLGYKNWAEAFWNKIKLG